MVWNPLALADLVSVRLSATRGDGEDTDTAGRLRVLPTDLAQVPKVSSDLAQQPEAISERAKCGWTVGLIDARTRLRL